MNPRKISTLLVMSALASLTPLMASADVVPEEPEEAADETADAETARRARVYARFEGGTVTVGEIEDAINAQSPFMRERFRERSALVELAQSLVRARLLAQEAERRGIDERAVVSQRVKQGMVQLLLQQRFPEDEGRAAVTDADVRAYYDAHSSEFGRPEMVRAAHIRLANREDADAILEEVRAADVAEFRELARRHSLDAATKLSGGDLRFFTRDGRPAGARTEDDPVNEEIVQVAFSLEELGQVSDPVEIRDGFHLVKLTGRRAERLTPFDRAEAGIRSRLWRERRQEAIEEFVNSLREATPPEINRERMLAIELETDEVSADISGAETTMAPSAMEAPAEE